MAKRTKQSTKTRVADVCDALKQIASLGLAQDWDNVGLLAGDDSAVVRRLLLCIDLTPAVVEEAIRTKCQFVMAYHPPIFKPISRLVASSSGADASIFRCIANGIAIYSMHTALDCAAGGTNDVLASLCNLIDTEPIEYTTLGPSKCKLAVFVPQPDADKVANAMFLAGAGDIADYQKCSFASRGEGTFQGAETTNPAVGKAGRFERVAELRLETVVPQSKLPNAVVALCDAHPYEEPAFDIYPLKREPVRGIGCVGRFKKPTTLGALAARLKKMLPAECTLMVGDSGTKLSRGIVCVGSAGSLPFKLDLQDSDVIVTGEIRHHDALSIRRRGCSAIALSHWASERPALAKLANMLGDLLPVLEISLSKADCDPFSRV